MAGTLVKRVLLQISADDGDAEAKLEAIGLKADELRDKHPELKIRIDTAEAQAKMAILRAELKDLSAKADEEAAKGGILSRFLGGSGLGSILSKIPGVNLGGGAGGAAGDAAGAGGGNPSAMGVLIGTAVATAPAWLTELDALVSGFAAAGAGAGAFYLLAHPAISNLQSDVSSLSSANQALGIAQQKYLIDPTKANATALRNAQDTYHAVYNQMGQDAGGAAGGVVKLHDEYVKLSTAFQPEAFKVFNGVLTVANELLPHVAPFATTFADAFSGLLGQAGKFAGSKGFTDWLSQFQKLEGPSIGAIGAGVGHLVTTFGKLLTTMSAKDVVNGLNIAFSVLDGTMLAIIWVIRESMKLWDELTTSWDQTVRAIRRGSHDVAEGFGTARHAAATFGHDAAEGFDGARHAAATGGHDIASSFDRLRHDVAQKTDETGSFVKSHWKEIAGWIVSPIGMANLELRTHTHQIAQEFDSLRHDTASILAGMRHDIAAAFDGFRHDSAASMDGLRHGVASAWDSVRHDAAAWGDDMMRAVKHAWDDIFGSTKRGSGQVTGEAGRLPGLITSQLARLPGDMLNIGRNTVEGLIHGIESAAAAIPGIMKSLAGDVESYFTNPLKIFSPSRVMFEHGRMVPEGVALGIEAGTPRIRAAAAAMARVTAAPLAGGAVTGSAAAAGGSHVTIQITGDAALRQWLKKSIRVTGGNVQVVGA